MQSHSEDRRTEWSRHARNLWISLEEFIEHVWPYCLVGAALYLVLGWLSG